MDYERFKELAEKWAPALGERDAALELVLNGQMTPDEAEALAKAQGWQPFARHPTGPKYDPMQRPFWTLPMIIEWIAFRRLAADSSPEWRSEARVWEDNAKGEWQLSVFNQMSLWRLLISKMQEPDEATRSAIPAALNDAEADLKKEAEGGRIALTALNPARIRTPIAPEHWQDLELLHEIDSNEVRFPNGERWTDPTAKASDVMTIWPAAPVQPAATIIEEEPAPKELEGSEPDAKKGSEADARRAWEQELAEVRVGTQRQRSQKAIEADYPTRFHVSRETVRSWIKGTRGRGRPRRQIA